MSRAINYKHCDNCIKLVNKIKEYEAFCEWLESLPKSRYDEISIRLKEVIDKKGNYYEN